MRSDRSALQRRKGVPATGAPAGAVPAHHAPRAGAVRERIAAMDRAAHRFRDNLAPVPTASPTVAPATVARAEFAAASVTLAEALRLSAVDPADAVRLIMPLVEWRPSPIAGGGPLRYQMRRQQDAMAATMRCAALASLARAVASYRPVSYQDAQSLRIMVCGAIDAEATIAADAGQDATYQALRTLYAAVALDLAVRGATLPRLVEVTTPVSMPSLTEAWALYQDTSREPALVASANPAHPLFMPTTFPALSK